MICNVILLCYAGMAEQHHLHRYDGRRVRVGLGGGFTGPQARAYSHIHYQRHRHRRLLLQPELRALHALPVYERRRVSILHIYYLYLYKLKRDIRIGPTLKTLKKNTANLWLASIWLCKNFFLVYS